MHEMALCQGVLEVALEAAGGRAVRRVRVRAGEFQGVVAESWEFCWQLVSADGPAAGALVELTPVAAKVHCRDCGFEGRPEPPRLCRCGSAAVDVLAGDELVVEEVELAGGEVRRNPALIEEA